MTVVGSLIAAFDGWRLESDAMAFWPAVGYSHDHRIVRYVKTVADVAGSP